MKGKSTTDAINILQQIVNKVSEYNIEMDMLNIDYKQDFDSVKRNKLTDALPEI